MLPNGNIYTDRNIHSLIYTAERNIKFFSSLTAALWAFLDSNSIRLTFRFFKSKPGFNR